MDKSRTEELRKTARQVVKRASRPGGALEKGEFTMGIARSEVCKEMGLEPGTLDSKEWKAIVKESVNNALETVGEEQSEAASPKKGKTVERSKENVKKTEVGTTKGESSKSKSKSSKRANSVESDDQSVEEVETVEEKASKKSSNEEKSSKSTAQSRKKSEDAGSEDAAKSESEMSSLYDIEPTRKRKSKSHSKGSKANDDNGNDSDAGSSKKEKRSKKDPNDGLSPEELKVVELKKIVVACGVRKQWSKEFADTDSPKEQKRRLESILLDLGMKGTPTIGKAKALKEKRELAAELDDVKEFEAARGVSAGRASRSKKGSKSAKGDSDEEEEEEEEEVEQAPRPKNSSALAAVMDFLGDESDSD